MSTGIYRTPNGTLGYWVRLQHGGIGAEDQWKACTNDDKASRQIEDAGLTWNRSKDEAQAGLTPLALQQGWTPVTQDEYNNRRR